MPRRADVGSSAFPPGLQPLEDTSAASWVEDALAAWPSGRFRVRELVPPVFEAYGRILHGVQGPRPEDPVAETWAATARPRGVVLLPETRSEDVFGGWPKADMSLTWSELAALVPMLRRHTSTPETCSFCVWEGYASIFSGSGGNLYRELRDGPVMEWRLRWAARKKATKQARFERRLLRRFGRVGILRHGKGDPPGRSYLLFTGPVEIAARILQTWGQAPNLWWPEDRAWFVHTEVDGFDSYVGGSRALVDELTTSPSIECLELLADTVAAG